MTPAGGRFQRAAVLMVMAQSALGGAACVTSPLLLASTVHSALLPPGPPVIVKWKTPPTLGLGLGLGLGLWLGLGLGLGLRS